MDAQETKLSGEEGGSVMIYLGGSKTAFRCDYSDGKGPCNCNVFTRLVWSKYKCNSCGMVYAAE